MQQEHKRFVNGVLFSSILIKIWYHFSHIYILIIDTLLVFYMKHTGKYGSLYLYIIFLYDVEISISRLIFSIVYNCTFKYLFTLISFMHVSTLHWVIGLLIITIMDFHPLLSFFIGVIGR